MSIEILRPAGTPEPTPADPVRVAVVGLGYWGPNLVRNLHEQELAELVAVCDRREDALAKIGARYPGLRLATELDEILADDEERQVRHELLVEAMESLNDREKHILTERRLIDEPKTLEDLSQVYGVSRERIRQIENSTLKRLEAGDYGYCVDTGEEIGLDRLEARLTAERTIDAQERWEHMQKQQGD